MMSSKFLRYYLPSAGAVSVLSYYSIRHKLQEECKKLHAEFSNNQLSITNNSKYPLLLDSIKYEKFAHKNAKYHSKPQKHIYVIGSNDKRDITVNPVNCIKFTGYLSVFLVGPLYKFEFDVDIINGEPCMMGSFNQSSWDKAIPNSVERNGKNWYY
jgi:hypothetical protein